MIPVAHNLVRQPPVAFPGDWPHQPSFSPASAGDCYSHRYDPLHASRVRSGPSSSCKSTLPVVPYNCRSAPFPARRGTQPPSSERWSFADVVRYGGQADGILRSGQRPLSPSQDGPPRHRWLSFAPVVAFAEFHPDAVPSSFRSLGHRPIKMPTAAGPTLSPWPK